MLNVIHSTRDSSGNIQYYNLDEITGFPRFLELT